MRRRIFVASTCAALLALPVHQVAQGRVSSRATEVPATLGPLVSGETSSVEGTHVWTDYAYDDRGIDSDLFAGGDVTYPDDAAPGNAADIIQVQLAPAGGGVSMRFVLNSLVDRRAPLVGVGFDTDRDARTGAATLPGDSWRTLTPIGLERVAVLSADGGEVLEYTAGAWQRVGQFATAIDEQNNTIDAVISGAMLRPGQSKWRAVAVAGITAGGQSWLNGGPIYDLAYLRAEDPYTEAAYAPVDAAHQASGQLRGQGADSREWQDHRQADVLAGRLDSANATAVVDFGLLGRGETALAAVTEPGFHTFLHKSGMILGEGVQAEPRQYRGLYSPYLVRIPAVAEGPQPLIVFLHGGHANHLQSANYFAPSRTDDISPGYFDPQAIVIFPLGRDPEWIPATSETDFLESVADAVKRLPIDPKRIVLTGISGGASGSLRYGQLYPDRWAGIYPLSGGGGPNFFENLDHLPVRMANGLLDPLGGSGNITLTANLLEQVGTVDYEIWLANLRSHVPMPGLGDCVLRDLVSRTRVESPPRVTYTFDPTISTVDADRRISLTYDRAYWVSGLSARPIRGEDRSFLVPGYGATVHLGEDPTARIDVTSLAKADREESGSTTRAAYENASAGRDFCGPNAALRSGDSWEEQKRKLQPAAPVETSNGMTLAMRNLASATLDTVAMGLRTDKPIRIITTGDGPASLRLLGQWTRPVTLEKDGVVVGSLRPTQGGVLVTDDFSGAHDYVLR